MTSNSLSKVSFFRRISGNLTGLQAHIHRLIFASILLITGNTLFLLARRVGLGCSIDGEDRCIVSEFYQLMVLSHSVVGIVMAYSYRRILVVAPL